MMNEKVKQIAIENLTHIIGEIRAGRCEILDFTADAVIDETNDKLKITGQFKFVKPEPIVYKDGDDPDTEHYDYDSYTTGRKQDHGHHELNEENGWHCYDWNRGDYTEDMFMKRPKAGKVWKPFRVYTYSSTFKDFKTLEAAQAFHDERVKSPHLTSIFIEIGADGKEIRQIATTAK